MLSHIEQCGARWQAPEQSAGKSRAAGGDVSMLKGICAMIIQLNIRLFFPEIFRQTITIGSQGYASVEETKGRAMTMFIGKDPRLRQDHTAIQ